MSKIIDSIIGHAVGDAMGVPTEFCIRERLLSNPVTKMIGSAKTGQPAGSWSDDTSMEICTIDSFIQNSKFDYADIMTKWSEWINENKYTANGETFDVGRTCLRAIRNFSRGETPTNCGLNDENSNGNGSLMRMLPVALYSYYRCHFDNEIMDLTNNISSLTHAHNISKLGCYIYVRFIMCLLDGKSKEEAYEYIKSIDYLPYGEYAISKYDRILKNDIKSYKIDDISSSGYVVDTLECALWILLNSNSYEETIIASTNIGNDTDTIGAIAGSMAGIIYGINSIPGSWLDTLLRKDYLIDLAYQFENKICNLKHDVLIGTAIGDIVGSIYELSDCKSKKNFKLFNKKDRFTDDTVMTFAVAKSLISFKDIETYEPIAIDNMVEVGRKYLNCGYGPSFLKWLKEESHLPYGSFGNGAAMRISSIPMFFNDEDTIKKVCKIVTNVSHNHDDSVIGAESICMAIHLALIGKTKKEIKEYIEMNYFKLDSTVKELQDSKEKVIIKCLDTAKVSIICFLESFDYEDAIRNAISIGGDSDTIGAITGGIASAYYGIPDDIYKEGCRFLDEYLKNIHKEFNECINPNIKNYMHKISREEFNSIKEENVMFITNPGRMYDEDGTTFIIKNDNEFIIYRISGWMYGDRDDNYISLEDTFKIFPEWEKRWHNSQDEQLKNKYKYIYTGFGNGLSIDKSIYDEYYKYLIDKVKKHKSYNLKDGDNYNPSINISVWDEAFFKYAKDHNIKVRKPN